jgi:RNA polymerase sigma-70 factor (ECF subfamily)
MDNELFWKLLEPVHPMAAAFCQKLAGDRDEGNDLYQDALLTAMRRFGSLRDHAAFRPWLFRIVINSYKNRYRSFWWRRRVPMTPELLESRPGSDPRDRYDSRRLLQRILVTLNPEDQALVVLHEIEGRPISELAAIFKKPEGTIKTRLFRAKRMMRDKLERMLPKPDSNLSVGEAIYALRRSKTAND